MVTRSRRRGFTLVELLIVIVILALLAGIIFPAVRLVQRRAEQSSCLSKINNLGKAVQTYVSVNNGGYPLATWGMYSANAAEGAGQFGRQTGTAVDVWATSPGNDTYYKQGTDENNTAGYSWVVKLLPYLDEQTLADNINTTSRQFHFPAFAVHGGDAKLTQTEKGPGVRYKTAQGVWRHPATEVLTGLRCPGFRGESVNSAFTTGGPNNRGYQFCSSSGQPDASTAQGSETFAVTITNYKALSATHFACMQNPANIDKSKNNAEEPNGVIVPQVPNISRGVTEQQIPDGISKTLLFAESKEQTFSSWYDGTTSWLVAIPLGGSKDLYGQEGHGANCPNCVIQPMKVAMAMGAGQQMFWKIDETKGAPTHAINYGPSSDFNKNYSNDGLGLQTNTYKGWKWGPSSDHSGVVNHAFADGHAGSIAEDIDANLYMQLVTRNGREQVADPTVK